MKRSLILLLGFGCLPACTGYNSYPGMPVGGYGYPPPVNYGYGYPTYPVPAYGYYPPPVYYGRSYGGYGYSDHTYRPPVSNDQKALNYLYDHRNEIKRLPPQQRQQILREAQKLSPQGKHHHHND